MHTTNTSNKKSPRNNKYDNSNIAMSCPEPTYLTRAAMHAFTPPDTPAKRGKLLATVAGRDLPAQQLQHSGHRKSFVHCNSAILDRVCQFNVSLYKRAGHQASHYWKLKLGSHAEKPSSLEESNRLASSSEDGNKYSLSSLSLEIKAHNPWLTSTTPSS